MWKKKLGLFAISLLSILAAALATVALPHLFLMGLFVLTPTFNPFLFLVGIGLFLIANILSEETGLVTLLPL